VGGDAPLTLAAPSERFTTSAEGEDDMGTFSRKSSAVWRGNGADGKGELTTQSGAFKSQPYSAKMRFGSEDGRLGTNPEELVAAAHAGCFAMALSFGLTGAGFPPEQLDVTSTVRMASEGVHWSMVGIDLALEAKVAGISDEAFQAAAESAKKNCPISKALAAVPITLTAKRV
jgi:osmotically inducible protein OsmC